MKMAKRLYAMVAGTLALAVGITGFPVAVDAAAAESRGTVSPVNLRIAGAECSVNDPETSNRAGLHCVNGTLMRARGYNRCIAEGAAHLAVAVYRPHDCYGGRGSKSYPEAIAQARFVEFLSPTVPGAVKPAQVQWEARIGRDGLVRLPSGRADVLRIGTDPNPRHQLG